ncbi:MAG TPA: hypothetical protein VFS20_15820 [Longimicrobium sp.]|nr:hypothetical protein [Longimicrobium sp.]
MERLADAQRSAPSSMSERDVIAAGYLERLRLGVGSPFRLMEYALLDPRLTPATRTPLVWALLDATRAGRGYELDPRALTRIGTDAASREVAAAQRHLELIDRAVVAGDDPRSGELAVRKAYELALASRSVSPVAPELAASAAALVRDRELARRDAERLLSAAARSGKHPFALLAEWRKQRRFEVEAPPGAPRAAAVETEAGVRAVALLEEVEAFRAASAHETQPREKREALRRLAPAAGRRLAKIAQAHAYPPQAPVWITVQRHDTDLWRIAGDDVSGRRAVGRLLEMARTEESLAAEQASLNGVAPPVAERVAQVALEASVAMRTYAQEKVWFPGFPGPSDADLVRNFGVRTVEFGERVPVAWRPYYRRMLWEALADLELVLPSLDLRGAGFKFGTTGKEGVALAIHDPHGRGIVLPPESGAGAIAHEVGHDLDWQVAAARYNTRASYGTDHAARAREGDRFAAAVRRMPTPPEVPIRGGPELQRRYTQRAPEVFARTFDGYVATALAARGRSNGYLTASQDDFLGGHGLALVPGAREDAEPFMEMMMVVSPVPERARRDFLARWDAGRVPSGFELADRIVAGAGARVAPPAAVRPVPGMAELLAAGQVVRKQAAAVMAQRDSVVAQWSAARCRNPFVAHGPRGEAAVRRLTGAAASARIRGIVLVHARTLGFDAAPQWLTAVWLPAPPRDADQLSLAPRDGSTFAVAPETGACREAR